MVLNPQEVLCNRDQQGVLLRDPQEELQQEELPQVAELLHHSGALHRHNVDVGADPVPQVDNPDSLETHWDKQAIHRRMPPVRCWAEPARLPTPLATLADFSRASSNQLLMIT